MGLFEKSDLKFFILIVGSSVVATVITQFALRWMEQKAILAARAEMQKLILATSQQQTEVSPASPIFSDNPSLGYTNIA